MQRRPNGQKSTPRKEVSQPLAPNFTNAQMAEFMANAEGVFASNGGQTRYFVHGPLGLYSQQEPDQTWRSPVQDGMSSIRGVTDDTLSMLESRVYDPFGNPVDAHGLPQTPFGFTGEMTAPNGLVHLRARDYDPALGVFPNLDPVTGNVYDPTSLNPYVYARNNPVNWVDPSGNVTMPNQWHKCQAPTGPKACPPNSWANGIGECCFSYNRYAARDYAIAHAPAGHSHPAFCDYPTTCGGGTDCANFVSQAMRAGGHPMHFAGGIETFRQTQLTSATNDWACRTTEGDPTHCIGSQDWRGAVALSEYVGSFGLPSVNSAFLPGAGSSNEETWQAVIDFGRSVHGAGIGVGDMLYIPTGPDKQHVALIVGWGPPLRSWKAFLDSPISVYPNYAEGLVPYVVDHGTQRSIADQPSGRPYYFLNWSPSQYATTPSDFHEVSDWVFKRLPNVVCKPSDDVITYEEAMTRTERA